ncbi:EmrB/QacA subfamily drug resistance transporter [Chitinophaga skermanii]|uniref:EmrB/QacA subfamily drug resistance transporter n=1 Tax=Chitinophaga skermanii TaxID=331697 RepID=A0A327QAM0_9BACT|nr:MFS transporter [Chitinophaga skermanii]RAJ00263.1 EmrB/QacA subfamily drug resistance transporter [Chitinophaga skermanii]
MKIIHRKWISLIVLLMAHLLTIIDIFIVNVAIPAIQQGLGAKHSSVQLVVAMYMVGFASFLISGGKLGDYFGRKQLFITGLGLFMFTSIGCGLAISPSMLISMRFFQGAAAAMLSPQVLSFIQVLFPEHQERTYALGWFGITIGIGTMLGQYLGGYFVELDMITQPWRLIFLVNVPVCVLAILMAKHFLPRSKDDKALELDYKGAMMLSALLVLIFIVLTMSEDFPILISILTGMAAFLLAIYFYFHLQNRKDKSILNPQLFNYKSFNTAIIAVALFMMMLDAYFFILSIFLQEGLHFSPSQASLLVVCQGAGFIIASFMSARWVLRFGKSVLILGTFLIMSSLLLQLMGIFTQPSSINLHTLLFVHGFGVALVLPSFANIALKNLPAHLVGNASGVYSTAQQLFGAMGIALTGGVFYYIVGKPGNIASFKLAFTVGTAINILCLIGVLILLCRLPRTILPTRKKLKEKILG